MATRLRKRFQLRSSFATYTATELLGQGGGGRVFGIEDQDGTRLACKILELDRATAERRQRFKNEYRFCSTTDHPNVIRMTDHGVSEEGAPFVVMPRYPGSLRGKLAQTFDPAGALRIFSDILNGVEAAHLKGVTHRDLKPENILITSDGAAVVADFGISRFTAEDLYTAVETREASRLANFVYAAPEQRHRGRDVGLAADLYALGLILNEIFTGHVPHGTDFVTIGSLQPDYVYLDDIVSQLIRQQPSDRFSSIDALKVELLGRRNAFVARQQLNAVTKQVVPTAIVVDPLIDEPVRIVGADWDEGGTLSIEFNHDLNPRWVGALRNMGSYASVMGKDPDAFSFSGRYGRIGARGDEVQRIIDHFKNWLPKASAVYEMSVRREKEEREERTRRSIEEARRRAEERARVLDDLKI